MVDEVRLLSWDEPITATRVFDQANKATESVLSAFRALAVVEELRRDSNRTALVASTPWRPGWSPISHRV